MLTAPELKEHIYSFCSSIDLGFFSQACHQAEIESAFLRLLHCVQGGLEPVLSTVSFLQVLLQITNKIKENNFTI